MRSHKPQIAIFYTYFCIHHHFSTHISTQHDTLSTTLAASYNPAQVPAFWMGADERKKERNWVYTDGSHFDFTNWNSGQPTPHSIVPDGSPYDEVFVRVCVCMCVFLLL